MIAVLGLKKIAVCVIAGLVGALAALSASANGELVISIETDKAEYVLTEPIRLSVRYENVGETAVNIMPARDLGANMTCTFYEVTERGGVVVRRKHQFAYISQFVNPDYQGELLQPSDYIDAAMYPALSRSLPGEADVRSGFTFDSVGEYRLRFAYSPPSEYQRLWRPIDGEPLFSNEIVIQIRAPSDVEKSILDAYWTADRSDLAMGDNAAYIKIDETLTRQVLAEHSDHPFADYLRWNLARGLMKPASDDSEVIEILEELRPKPFRWDEVHLLLGSVYSTRGDTQRSLEVLYEAIEVHPQLLRNDTFMKRVILATTKSPQKLIQWELECARGERMRFAGIAIPQQLLDGSRE